MNLLDINFYSEEANNGDSIIPFLGFLTFLGGLLLLLFGVVNFVLAWREFDLWYDSSALDKKPDKKEKKVKMRKYGIMIVIGILMMGGSYLFY